MRGTPPIPFPTHPFAVHTLNTIAPPPLILLLSFTTGRLATSGASASSPLLLSSVGIKASEGEVLLWRALGNSVQEDPIDQVCTLYTLYTLHTLYTIYTIVLLALRGTTDIITHAHERAKYYEHCSTMNIVVLWILQYYEYCSTMNIAVL